MYENAVETKSDITGLSRDKMYPSRIPAWFTFAFVWVVLPKAGIELVVVLLLTRLAPKVPPASSNEIGAG